MKGFIEVHQNEVKRVLLNVKHIETVIYDGVPLDNSCTIYLAFNVPDAYEQDYIIPDETYEEVLRKIEEAMG